MACKSSCGADEICSKVDKHACSPIHIYPLPHIFNIKFSAGKIPNDLKVALVTPV